ncbi:MAG: hypothetical protein R3E51_00965 [Rhizobiaceae bacterium]|jgi:predicted membrane-bound spermidine synthase
MNWKRVVGYGVALWSLPFVLSFMLFPIREANRPLFESLITVIGVLIAVTAAVLYFRYSKRFDISSGIILGVVWAAISIGLDIPIFLLVFHMNFIDYMADIALTYMAFPAITVGIALARYKATTTR